MKGCTVADTVTHPVGMVLISRTTKPIRFQPSVAFVDCEQRIVAPPSVSSHEVHGDYIASMAHMDLFDGYGSGRSHRSVCLSLRTSEKSCTRGLASAGLSRLVHLLVGFSRPGHRFGKAC